MGGTRHARPGGRSGITRPGPFSSATPGYTDKQYHYGYLDESEAVMLLLGIILLVIGLITGISILWTIGLILAVVGGVLWILGATGRAVAGRRHYW
ncbi:hypothetical protein [Streptomyces sp. NPDC029554]|uniref:hypothetical protein n=1 Tax=Streptomyces sp. NPDC029554 TaxID=3155126 RepID=UPI0033C12140